MDRHKLNKMFDGLAPAPGQERELLEKLLQDDMRRKKPMKNWKRIVVGVAAAALLVTGAAAANSETVANLIERLTVHLVSAEEYAGFTVDGEQAQYPLNAFSPALNTASEGRESPAAPVDLRFSTWAEVREFLGEDIPCVWPNEGKDWNGDFQVVLFHTELEKLWGINVYSVDISRQIVINVYLYTEHWPKSNESIAGLLGSSETSIKHLESYVMKDGSTAELVMQTESGEHPRCSAFGHFMRAGILYQVEALGVPSTQEETISRLKSILDSFQ